MEGAGHPDRFPAGAPPAGLGTALEVSIVMPCLNEGATLATCIGKAYEALRAHHLTGEVIVADNGSTDGSPDIARALGARVVEVPIRGYGAALMGGIAAARGAFVVMGDADDSYDFSAIFPFVARLRAGDDFVIGCRFPRGGGRAMPGAMPPLHRWLGTPVLSAIGRLFFRCPVIDFNCGLRAFRRDRCIALDLRSTGMEFASEMLVKASLSGARIGEVPITLYKDGRRRPPHLRTWRDGWRHLRFMLLYSPRWLFLLPGFAIFLAGLMLGIMLMPGPLPLGRVRLDTNALLVAALAVLVGFQLVTFAVFSKVFAISEGLLPSDPRLTRVFNLVTLEVGIVVGILCAGAGVATLGWQVLAWQRQDFGALSYPASLRVVIPAVTAITLGIQIVFSSFFLSILGLRRR
jgi:hypothetical protein